MKIASMVTGYVTTPQPLGITYAPIDVAVAINEGLQALGHTVDYFAPEGSKVKTGLVTAGLEPLPSDNKGWFAYPGVSPNTSNRISALWDDFLIGEMVKRAQEGQYDLLHIHPTDRGLPFGRALPKILFVYTLHDPISAWRADMYAKFHTPNQHFVSLSQAQRTSAPNLQYSATIHNGISLDVFTFSAKHNNHLLFAGRMIPEKGADVAVKVAQKTKHALHLYGQSTIEGSDYFKDKVQPYLSDSIEYKGFLARTELSQRYGQAKAVVMPINWDEPFGLVMIEAMACGTPVVAFRRGAAPEIIVHGVTGFVVDTVEEMIEAVKHIDTIDRKACRDHVVKNFSNTRMAEQYEALFKKVINERAA